jgi:hypothetical protein
MTENAKRLFPALALAAALVPAAASAQLYKCKGPDGKTVYSDSKCEASEAGALKVTPMATTPSAREKAAAEEKAAREAMTGTAAPTAKVPVPAAAPAPAEPPPYQLTSSDQERLRNLEVDRGRAGATAEQKSAYELEMRHIRSGRDARLSGEDRSKREALHSDLTSNDAQKRRKALSDFRSLYN